MQYFKHVKLTIVIKFLIYLQWKKNPDFEQFLKKNLESKELFFTILKK